MPGTIASTRELARTFENEVRVGGVAKRRWVCMLSDNALTAGGPPDITTILNATCGGTWGVAHPIHTALGLRKLAVNERFEDNPYALEVIVEYGLIKADDVVTPTSRASVWSFESKPGEVPALFYYDGSTQRPLTNSAFDYFPGLTTEETLVQIKVSKNFSSVPSSWLSVQNYVNNATFLGCPQDTVKVAGVDVQYAAEEFNNTLIQFYAATATLAYRQSSHNLLLPDVGFNFIDGTQKRRAMVFDFQNAEWVASPNPVGLDGSGGLTLGAPAILTRRVNPRADFTATFGAPP
ncbi:MAG: hypothetical protein EBR82_55110 [Caulobacteraceae bacterium]|nr:hypothetical protein [Caulobacteraceae bacterium]